MKARTFLLAIKVKLSIRTILKVMSKWQYLLLAIFIAFIFFELIYWLFNLRVLFKILASGNITISDKLAVLVSPIESIASSSGMFLSVVMILLAVVQGLSLGLLIYVIRHQRKLDDKLIGGSSFVALLAVIGLGCPACGTSLITPIVAIFISGSAIAVSEKITAFATPLALIIGIYGLYIIGLKAANVHMRHQGQNNVA
jgi:hypothetical protein